jgi:alpha-L-rhamnosidase
MKRGAFSNLTRSLSLTAAGGYRSLNFPGAWCGLSLVILLSHAENAQPASDQGRAGSDRIRPVSLRCEYAQNPLGVDEPRPQLSWQLEVPQWGQAQAAYQILVASSPSILRDDHGDLWDSGRVDSDDSTHVIYDGAPLSARMRCLWKVRVWDTAGQVSEWSQPALWEMGLLRPADWQARWIGSGPPNESRPPTGFFKSTNELTGVGRTVQFNGRSVLLRKSFKAESPIRQARVFVTGLGYYELSCNGHRVGDRVLAPAKSNYRNWVFYDTYDLVPYLQVGTNVLGVMLGNGWFNPYPKWWQPYRMQWFGSPRALLQLHVDYADGTSEIIASDESWKIAPGPILSSCVYDGETYDATQEIPGWNEPGGSAAGWEAANLVEEPGGRLVSQLMPPIRVVEHRKPLVVRSPRPGTYVFDLGQNFAGWVRLTAKGSRGVRITLRYAEDLKPDGMIDVTSNEAAAATDIYVMNGRGQEVYEPRFTFHGFRYVEVTGFPGVLTLDHLVGCVVHSACENTGSFICDNPLINRIHRATIWSQRSNLIGYPMDCPQRDERLGWFGDAMVSAEEAMFNFDMALLYRHWLEGIRLNQNPATGDISIISPRPYLLDEPDPTWTSAYIVMAWQYYLNYGDRRFLERHFEAMSRYVAFLGTQATNYVLPKYWIGDWGTIVTGWKEGDPASVSTGFYYYNATILAKAARALGRVPEAQRNSQLAEEIRAAYNRAFFDQARTRYDSGSQFSNAFPLFLGLVDTQNRSAVLRDILEDLQAHQGHFTVGVLGAKYLIDALTENGRGDVAFQLATQTGYPSWAHMLDGDRTTLSEFWDLHGSHNHIMMGSIDGWFYRTLAGIQPDENQPGFRHFTVKPFFPNSLSWVRAEVETVRGRVQVAWAKRRGEVNMTVIVPSGASASVHVPGAVQGALEVVPRFTPVRFEPQGAVAEVGPGKYEFRGKIRE